MKIELKEIENFAEWCSEMELMESGRYDIPDDCKETIDNYVIKGWRPGSFIEACLANDLAGATGAADSKNWRYITGIVGYIYNNVPATLWRSYERIDAHLESFKKDEL